VLVALYCSRVESAPRDVKYILDEASILGNTLCDFDRLLKGLNGDEIDSSQSIRRTLGDCRRQLNNLAAKLEPGPIWKRLVWPLKKEEVAAITEKLGRCRSTIFVRPTGLSSVRI
jgi:hypothetical protein